jgi:hypothetical protein
MNSGLNALGMVANSFLNLIPGQAAWQNSVASAQSGNYGQAAAHFGIMAAEMVVTAYTAGAGGSAIAASRAAPMTVTAARVEAAAARGVSPGIKALSEANITDNGITVLGRFQAPPGQINYIQKATTGKHAGSSYFDLGSAWTPIEGKAANLNFLDIVGGRGDKMIFSTPKNKISSGTSLDMEVQYLQETFGYKWVNQWSMQVK